MKVLRGIFDEIIGLFVDDWAFALLLLAWVGVFYALARSGRPPSGLIFFAGLAVLTLAFVVRRARSLRR